MNRPLLSFKAMLFVSMALVFSDALAQEWEQLSPSPFYKHHSNAFEYQGKAYIFEGVFTNDLSRAMWSYDPVSDTWTSIADFPGPARSIAIGDEWDGKYYYGFGSTNQQYLNDLWVFNPADSSFTELTSCPCVGRNHPALIAYEGKVFMGTGSASSGDLNDWWVYDIASDTWSQKASVPGGRRHHPFFFEDGEYVYVGGGHQLSWYKWHINDETWTAIDGEPAGRVAGTQFQHNGYGYALGGDDRFHNHVPQSESFMRYDPVTDTWERLPETPYGKWAPSSFIIDDYVYFFGGLSSDIQGNVPMIRMDLTALDQSSSTEDLPDTDLQLFPNPTSSGSFTLNFTSTAFADWDIDFVDITGRKATESFVLKGNGLYESDSKGTFIVIAQHPDGRRARRVIVLN